MGRFRLEPNGTGLRPVLCYLVISNKLFYTTIASLLSQRYVFASHSYSKGCLPWASSFAATRGFSSNSARVCVLGGNCDVPPHTQIPIVAECVASLISHRTPGSHETRALHVRSWAVPDNRISQLVVYGTVGLRCRFCDMSVRLSRRCRIVCSLFHQSLMVSCAQWHRSNCFLTWSLSECVIMSAAGPCANSMSLAALISIS